jgi:hypothetical protein
MSWSCWKRLFVFPAGEKCPASGVYANRRLLEEPWFAVNGTGFSMNGAEIAANADCFMVDANRFMENGRQFLENSAPASATQVLGATQVLDRTGWSDKVWSRRYQSIPVSSEQPAQIERLTYILANGVKENLVARVEEWPGVHSAHALLTGEPVEGTAVASRT